MLLRFRVANHRSIRDTAELSLVASGLDGTRPSDADWTASTVRVAAIYGSNASGKSTLLDAINFACSAIRYSATRWGDRDEFPHLPFSLDDESREHTSFYEFDISIKGIRYTYGFESCSEGISKEWLYSYPVSRRRILFERQGLDASSIEFGRHLPGDNMRISRLMRPTSLYLSTAANNNHEFLLPIHHWLARHVEQAQYSEADREARIRRVRDELEDPKKLRRALGLLKFADLGITDVVLDERDMSDEVKITLRHIFNGMPELGEGVPKPDIEEFFEEVKKKITFLHSGADTGKAFPLPLESESSGTVAWLSLGVPALECIRYGSVFVVDELDSSLHPRLAAALVGIFKDKSINPAGAQLIFTSHDTSLLGYLVDDSLTRDEVWFTEKDTDGSTSLFALNEFPARASDNFERRYLQGRYGAVPVISPEELHAALLQDAQK